MYIHRAAAKAAVAKVVLRAAAARKVEVEVVDNDVASVAALPPSGPTDAELEIQMKVQRFLRRSRGSFGMSLGYNMFLMDRQSEARANVALEAKHPSGKWASPTVLNNCCVAPSSRSLRGAGGTTPAIPQKVFGWIGTFSQLT